MLRFHLQSVSKAIPDRIMNSLRRVLDFKSSPGQCARVGMRPWSEPAWRSSPVKSLPQVDWKTGAQDVDRRQLRRRLPVFRRAGHQSAKQSVGITSRPGQERPGRRRQGPTIFGYASNGQTISNTGANHSPPHGQAPRPFSAISLLRLPPGANCDDLPLQAAGWSAVDVPGDHAGATRSLLLYYAT